MATETAPQGTAHPCTLVQADDVSRRARLGIGTTDADVASIPQREQESGAPYIEPAGADSAWLWRYDAAEGGYVCVGLFGLDELRAQGVAS